MFERLISNGIPHAMLDTQHRMRPCLSRLVTPSIYRTLHDHESVTRFPHVAGVGADMFFLTHSAPETGRAEGSLSHANPHEARFAVELATYLLRNGYDHTRLVILVAYQGQQTLARQLLRAKVTQAEEAFRAGGGGAASLLGGAEAAGSGAAAHPQAPVRGHDAGHADRRAPPEERTGLSGVRVETIDSYQGLQSDVVILSLVRSNRQASVGFLQETNRVVVALTRARHGLFILGDAALLDSWCNGRKGRGKPGAEMWTSVLATLEHGGSIGDALPLVCQRHPNQVTMVREAGDFVGVSDGGCTLPCEERLDCGHQCPQRCHSDGHVGQRCMKGCARRFEPCEHPCTQRCYVPCGSCPVPVTRVLPGCGHEQRMTCGRDVATFSCTDLCPRDPFAGEGGCGHPCPLNCGAVCPPLCLKKVSKPHPLCGKGHSVTVECGMPMPQGPCPVLCGEALECGHLCDGTCGGCAPGAAELPSHEPCRRQCERYLLCGHPCKSRHACSMPCPPCDKPCDTRCIHSKCRKLCVEPCTACVETCKAACAHRKCSRLCGDVCDREPCDEPCALELRCGHACVGLCGEPCPSHCLVCDEGYQCALSQSTLAELEASSPGARFVQLQDCGHTFEAGLLDGWMASQDVSLRQADDGDDGGAGPPVAIKLPCCPTCRKPVRRSVRYSRVLRACHLEIERIKELLYAGPGLRGMVNARVAAATAPGRKPKHVAAALGELQKLLDARLEAQPQSVTAHTVLAELLVRRRGDAPSAARARELCERALALLGLQPNGAAAALAVGPAPPPRPVPTLTARERATEAYHALAHLGLVLSRTPGMQEAARRRLTTAVRFAADAGLAPAGVIDVDAALRDADATELQMRKRAAASVGREGNWFRCANGHLYVIGECGGAMQRGVCPDCRASVGGESHRLDESNTRATDMAQYDRDGGGQTPFERMVQLNPAPQQDVVRRIQRGEL